MTNGSLADYGVIILDEKEGPSSWGQLAKKKLEDAGFTAFHATTSEIAIAELSREYYDLLIVDMDLGAREDGIDFQKKIRDMGLSQPVVFVTGNERFLETGIFQYTEVFARGPVLFYNKNSRIDLTKLVLEAASRVDPIRRSLYIMKKAGLGATSFRMGTKSFTVDQLLVPTPDSDSFVRALRESLQQLVLETVAAQEVTA